MLRRSGMLWLAAAVVAVGCGGSGTSVSPSSLSGTTAGAQPTPTPTPAPTPAAEATPTPTPIPTPTPENPDSYPNGEPVVARLTIKIEQVIGLDGQTRLISPEEGEPIYVGETIRFDATAKSADGRPTDGSGDSDPAWTADPTDVIELKSTIGFNPRATAAAPGDTDVAAQLDGVDSQSFWVHVVPAPKP